MCIYIQLYKATQVHLLMNYPFYWCERYHSLAMLILALLQRCYLVVAFIESVCDSPIIQLTYELSSARGFYFTNILCKYEVTA